MYLIQCATQVPNPVFAVHDSGKVRHIGPSELAYLIREETPVVIESDSGAAARLLAEARVSQGYLQN